MRSLLAGKKVWQERAVVSGTAAPALGTTAGGGGVVAGAAVIKSTAVERTQTMLPVATTAKAG